MGEGVAYGGLPFSDTGWPVSGARCINEMIDA